MKAEIDCTLADFFLSEKPSIKSPSLEYSPKAKLSSGTIDGWLVCYLDSARKHSNLLRFCTKKEIAILRFYYLARVIEQPKIIKDKARGPRVRMVTAREAADFLVMSVSAYKRALARAKGKVRKALM
jgi:hypothetical protein